jgi:uncharacterized MAPEG superfamily protein
MTIALWMILAAAVLPYLFAVIAKSGRDYDNSAPREYLARTTGWRQRSNWAQLNGFEAFPPFAAAVITAHMLIGSSALTNWFAIGFVTMRLLHGIFYIVNKATLRSASWAIGT